MDEARAVLARLERIEALDRTGATPELLLAELRALAREATEWARAEADPTAVAAAAACVDALAGMDAIVHA
jgi:primosomal protein N''